MGWDYSIKEELEGILSDIYDLKYEIENCRKGVYTKCETNNELADYIINLAESLMDSAATIRCFKDMEEIND